MEITIICTGTHRGDPHGRIAWDRFIVSGENIEHVGMRHGKAPLSGSGSAVDDGEAVDITIGPRMTVPAPPSRNAGGTWRWQCPECHLDRPLKDENLRRALIGLAAAGEHVLDLSLVPRSLS